MNYRHALSSLAVSALLLAAAPAQAYGFSCISGNTTNCGTFAQYSFTATQYSARVVSFVFSNVGPEQSTIAEIYFDDNSPLFGSLTVGAESNGVDFVEGANPGDLPAGSSITPQFGATAILNSQAEEPAPKKGVNPGGSVQLLLTLLDNKYFSDVGNDLDSGALRVGIHVINFEDGGSASFINTPVPEPETYAMALVALGVLGMYRRRQARSDKSTD